MCGSCLSQPMCTRTGREIIEAAPVHAGGGVNSGAPPGGAGSPAAPTSGGPPPEGSEALNWKQVLGPGGADHGEVADCSSLGCSSLGCSSLG